MSGSTGDETYHLVLYVAGDETHSRSATENLRRIGAEYLDGRHEVEIVDVFKDYQRALKNRIVVTPTLVLTNPSPEVTILGDLTDTESVLTALRLRMQTDEQSKTEL